MKFIVFKEEVSFLPVSMSPNRKILQVPKTIPTMRASGPWISRQPKYKTSKDHSGTLQQGYINSHNDPFDTLL